MPGSSPLECKAQSSMWRFSSKKFHLVQSMINVLLTVFLDALVYNEYVLKVKTHQIVLLVSLKYPSYGLNSITTFLLGE